MEHLFLALVEVDNPMARLLKSDFGLQVAELRKAIEELRKGGRVTSQHAEEQYNALSKYAINLCQRAREGKLDPVIGREYCRSSPDAPRTTPSSSGSQGSVRPLSPKVWPTVSYEATCPRTSVASKSIPSTWEH